MADLNPATLAPLQKAIGYAFTDLINLQAALIHTSYVNEHPGRDLVSNERLEFLGDAVLGMVVAHRLYLSRPDAPEGDLTVLRASLVRQSTLTRWAHEIRLGQFLLLGRGEARGGGRERPALLARAFEALIGAVYLDGGIEAARNTLEPFLETEIASGFTPQRVLDAKSRLQQVTQALFDTMPVYTLVEHSGPGHAPNFTVQVQAGPDIVARGSGQSKRTAQQMAAQAALRQIDARQGRQDAHATSNVTASG